jgi:hypothetical protein
MRLGGDLCFDCEELDSADEVDTRVTWIRNRAWDFFEINEDSLVLWG